MAVPLTHRRFSVDDYQQMARSGILSEDDRVELIEGEIVEMAPIGEPHQDCADTLAELLIPIVPRHVRVRNQGPIRLNDRSEPQPDIALIRRKSYLGGRPMPEDVFLVIEVADTTLDSDRNVKLRLYARANIPETWLVDLNGRVIFQCSEPRDDGYLRIIPHRPGDRITSVTLPSISLHVTDILA